MTTLVSSVDDFHDYFNVSRETIGKLTVFEALLKKWNPKINLVSQKTLADVWARHFADSAQIWRASEGRRMHWLDLGSGSGFPGLVVAAMAAQESPDTRISLVESDTRKSVFLRTAAREMGLKTTVHTVRIEDLAPQNADIISARALAPLAKLLGFAERHRSPDGICLFHKGVNATSELTAARDVWHISSTEIPSITDSDARILRIGEFRRVD